MIRLKKDNTKNNSRNTSIFFGHKTSQHAFFDTKRIQPKLKVEGDYPQAHIDRFVGKKPKGIDPSKSLTPAGRIDFVRNQLFKLSPHFKTESNGQVKKNHKKTEEELSKDPKGMASCCLHIMTRPSSTNDWKIVVADHMSPHTFEETHQVLINTHLNPVQFGHHTKTGKKVSYESSPQIILGHELCGHAALMELKSHPIGARATTNVHDPTVNVENAIAEEQGIKKENLRGLAADGNHKGESFGKMEVIEFGFNKYGVSHLPQTEKNKLKFISDIIRTMDLFVELRGHSDIVGSESAKQKISDKRAKSVFIFLRKLGVTRKAKVVIERDAKDEAIKDIDVNRFLLKGASDKEPRKGIDEKTEQHKNRRVEVFVSSFPAGLSESPKGISKKKQAQLNVLDQIKEPKTVKGLKQTGTPCEKKIIEKAF